MIKELLDTLPVAALFFEKDGGMNLVVDDEADAEELKSISTITSFFQYTLSRPDWISDFAKQTASTEKIRSKPRLRIIQGGLSKHSGSGHST